MEAESRVHRCQKCNKSYKTSSSLASHRYRVHPYAKSSSSSNSGAENTDDQCSLPPENSPVHDPHAIVNHDVSIKNLKSAVYQLRDFYEEMEQTIDKHDKALKHFQKLMVSNDEMKATPSTRRNTNKLSNRFSDSDNEEATDMESDSASVCDSPRSKRKNTDSARNKFFGL